MSRVKLQKENLKKVKNDGRNTVGSCKVSDDFETCDFCVRISVSTRHALLFPKTQFFGRPPPSESAQVMSLRLCHLARMGPKSRRWKQLSAARNAIKSARPDSDDAVAIDANDAVSEIYYLSDNEEADANIIVNATESLLQWKEGAGKHLRSVYTKSSRTTSWRKRKSQVARELSVSGVPKIETFFASVEQREIERESLEPQISVEHARASIEVASDSEPHTLTIDEALQKLVIITSITHNQNHEQRLNQLSKFDFVRFLAIEHYLTLVKRTGKKCYLQIEPLRLIFGTEILLVMVGGFVIGLISICHMRGCQHTVRDLM